MAVAVALLFSACHSSDPDGTGVDVYVAGLETMSNQEFLATVWKNGVPTRYSDGDMLEDGNHYTVFTSLCFVGDDMYTAGWVTWWNWDLLPPNPIGVRVATTWKNGTATCLADGTSWEAVANSIAVSEEGDVYAGGWEYISAPAYHGPGMATIWKNGVAQRLSEDALHSAGVYSVCLHGGDVYAAGLDYRPMKPSATLWVNGSPTYLNDENNDGEARCVVVSDDGDVYVGGYEDNDTGNTVATIWKNGVPQRLSSPLLEGCVHSIFVSGKDVYAAGREMFQGSQGYEFATVWKNGEPQHLSVRGRNAVATSVYVLDGNVYVAGYETDDSGKDAAMLWVNGEPQCLADRIFFNKANAVVVRRRK